MKIFESGIMNERGNLNREQLKQFSDRLENTVDL